MPVRSLNSPVLKWPDREAVLGAAAAWARELRAHDRRVLRVGSFGSYARGDAGVGSDLDLVVVVRDGEGSALFDVSCLPVPADVVVFEEAQWTRSSSQPSGLARTIALEVKWLEPAPPPARG